MLFGLIGLTESGKEELLKILINKYHAIIINLSKIYAILLQNLFFINDIKLNFNVTNVNLNSLNIIAKQGIDSKQKLHKIIKTYSDQIIAEIQQNHSPSTIIILYTISLLDFGLDKFCDKVIITELDNHSRAQRFATKTNISYEMALSRMSIQKSIVANRHNDIIIKNPLEYKNLEELLNFIEENKKL